MSPDDPMAPAPFVLNELSFRRLLEAAPDGMLIVDPGGRVVFANEQAQAMFGYSATEFQGLAVEQLVPQRYRGMHGAQREHYMHHPRTRPMAAGLPLTGVRKDGTEIPVEIALAPLETDGGMLSTAIVRDVSERRKLDVLKEQFLGILSHELRTPINAILGFASILEDGLAGPLTAEQIRYLQRIGQGADVLLNLIDDLLDMSRIQAGKFTLNPAVIHLEGLFAEVEASLGALAERKQLRWRTEIEETLPAVMADRQRLRQVLHNLLGNAIKFTPERGTVTLRAYCEDGDVHVEVADTGIGISEADQGRLFIPFSQVDMTPTRRSGGAGLGLAIAKSLVEAHGGTIGVRSAPGRGATFWFTIPAVPS